MLGQNAAYGIRQLAYARFAGVPGAHEARAADADEGVEHPAAASQRLQRQGRQADDDTVGLHREHQLNTRHIANQLGQQPRAAVGVFGVLHPGAALQQAHPGRGEKPHLGGELAGLLAAVLEVGGKLAIEEQDGFPDRHAVLRAAEAEHVDAGLPAQRRW